MKIVFVSRFFLPHLGGVEIHTHELATLLHRQGHEVSIVTLQHESRLKLHSKKQEYSIIRIPLQSDASKQAIWSEVSKMSDLFLDADIIHVHDVFWWLLPLYRKIRKKIYITFHGWETSYPVPLNAKIHRFLASILSQGSIHVGEYIQQFYFDKPDTVIYGGVNTNRFTKSVKKDYIKKSKVELVFVGRLEQDNSVLEYLDLFKRMKEKKIDFSVTWVGDGSLHTQCKEYGIVTGFVKNTSKYIRGADYVCASSYLSILEAQALGKIVISFYANKLKKAYLETYPGSSFMLISNTAKKMLQKMSHVFESSKLREQMQNDAESFASEQTWDAVLKKYELLWGFAPESFQKYKSISSKSVPVSLVVTILNEEKTIRSLLASILHQTVLPKEVLIIDGGSTDKTVDIISDFKSEYLSKLSQKVTFKVIKKPGNRSVGRNIGIKEATQKYIAITDAGCVLEKKWLEKLFAAITQQKNPVVAGYYAGLARTQFESAVIPYALVMPDRVDPQSFLPATRSVILDKKVFEKYGFFPEKFSDNEDYVFFSYLKKQGVQMGFEMGAIAYWRPRSTLLDFYTMIYRFARGDIQAKLFRPKVASIFIRYIILVSLLLLQPIVFVFVFLSYVVWSILKNKKYVKKGWHYLPVLQVVSDIAVIFGSIAGFLKLILPKF